MRDFANMYPGAADFRESTAAARANGYLGGARDTAALEAEIDSYGLSSGAREALLGRVGLPPGAACGI